MLFPVILVLLAHTNTFSQVFLKHVFSCLLKWERFNILILCIIIFVNCSDWKLCWRVRLFTYIYLNITSQVHTWYVTLLYISYILPFYTKHPKKPHPTTKWFTDMLLNDTALMKVMWITLCSSYSLKVTSRHRKNVQLKSTSQMKRWFSAIWLIHYFFWS